MIPGIWSRVKLVCGNHGEDTSIRMSPHAPAEGSVAKSLYGSNLELFYSCPKYYPQNRKDDEPLCRNHISVKEYETAVRRISDEMEAAMEDGGDINLKGYTWTSRSGVYFKVLKHTEKEIVLLCRSRKACDY